MPAPTLPPKLSDVSKENPNSFASLVTVIYSMTVNKQVGPQSCYHELLNRLVHP